MSSSTEENLNLGHRQRLRQRARRDSLDGFDDHQVLELVLFYAIPRADTNRIAHRLIQRFGSLSAVLEADYADLMQIKGIGEQAAVLIHLLPQLTRRYFVDRITRDKPTLNTPDKVDEYIKPLMAGRPEEVFYLLCLDSQCRVVHPALISRGTVKDAYVHPRKVAEAALRHNAASVILAHNHPGGGAHPSAQDHRLTHQLVQALGALDIPVLDHLIVADDLSYSFAAHGELPTYQAVEY